MHQRQRAFTLIELLVVIVIIGSMLGLAVFSMGSAGGSRELRNEAERLAAVMARQPEAATLDNRAYGVQLRRDGYRVLRYDEQRAQWMAQRDHPLPAWMQLDFTLEGTPLQLPASDEDDSTPANQPHLLLLSSGELSPFNLRLRDSRPGGQTYSLSSDGFSLPLARLNQTGK